MNVLVTNTYAIDRKATLGLLVRRALDAFAAAGIDQPTVALTLSDLPVASTSAVDRVIRRFPALAPFATAASPAGLFGGGGRSLALEDASVLSRDEFLGLCDSVPRSYPCHMVTVTVHEPGSPAPTPLPGAAAAFQPGITITDMWWVNGRKRSLVSTFIVEGAAGARTLPSPPEPMAAALAALGKPRKAAQMVVGPGATAPSQDTPAAPAAEIATRVAEAHATFRQRWPEVLAGLALPHDLAAEPPAAIGAASGPKKPALSDAFKPRGYTIKGSSGTFTLTKRTAAGNTIELAFDVGTWSNTYLGFLTVVGPGFRARLLLPANGSAEPRQIPIGDSARWQRIVENLAVVVDEAERSFVPQIDAAAGSAPAWFAP